jgi:deoxyribonuclease (pyrimidine dimer)
MTRVNLVPPRELLDQHLFAEWRELKMIPRSLNRTLQSLQLHPSTTPDCGYHKVFAKIPPTFTLNKGHVSFFYDKGEYIKERYDLLTVELLERGFTFDHRAPVDILALWNRLPKEFSKTWFPTEDDFTLIRARIAESVRRQPDWYRYYKRPLTEDHKNRACYPNGYTP